MKNKLLFNLKYTMLAVLLDTADIVYAKPVSSNSLKIAMNKYSVALFAIVVFSLTVYIGLTLYNKYFVSAHLKDVQISKDSLETPSDTENAIKTFISKNRLR